jgi:hypothetical protein
MATYVGGNLFLTLLDILMIKLHAQLSDFFIQTIFCNSDLYYNLYKITLLK